MRMSRTFTAFLLCLSDRSEHACETCASWQSDSIPKGWRVSAKSVCGSLADCPHPSADSGSMTITC